jgi:hypothetical protein
LLVAVLGHAALLLQPMGALFGAALPVAALMAVTFSALAFFADAALLLLAAQALLVFDPLAGATFVVAAVVVGAVARQGAADHARSLAVTLVRFACLAFACLLVAGKSLACVGALAVIVAMLRLRATFGPFALQALFVAARLFLPDLLASGLLVLGLTPCFRLSLRALLACAAFGLPATGVAARFGLPALLAGLTLRCLPPRGLLALLAGAMFGLLSCGLLASGILSVVVAAFGWLVLLLLVVDAFVARVVAGGGGRCDAGGQDSGQRKRAQDLSGEGELHVDHLRRRANVPVGPVPTLRARDEWALRAAGRIQRRAGVTVYRAAPGGCGSVDCGIVDFRPVHSSQRHTLRKGTFPCPA